MSKIKLIVVYLFFISTFFSCSKKDLSPTETQNTQYVSNLEKLSDNLITTDSIPGVIIGVWDNSKNVIWTKAKGKSDKSTGTIISTTDEVRIGSVGKTMIATVILQLVDENKVNLNEKISSYFPDFPKANLVTIKMLLNMTSGIFDYHYSSEIEDHLMNTPLEKYTGQQLIDIAAKYEYYFTPGTNYHYSNTNYIMLGMIIEKVTGNSAQQELQTRIWDKLVMTHTYYPENQNFKGEFAHGYSSDTRVNNGHEFDVSNYFDPSWLGVGCGIISTLDDMKKWTDAFVDGNLLSQSMKQEQMNFGIYNYGDGCYRVDNNGFIGHDGMVIGYTSIIGKNPSSGATIIIFTTRAEPVELSTTKYAWNVFNEVTNALEY